MAKQNSHLQREINEMIQRREIGLVEMKEVVVKFMFYSFLKPNMLSALGFHKICMYIYNNFYSLT